MPNLHLKPEEKAVIAKRLAAARWVAKLSLRDVAAQIGVSVNSITSWEKGAMLPRPEHRERLAALYGLPEAQLFAEYEAHLEGARDLLRPA
jgi:transcriptional regulator with XRE-family HTH domain